MKVFLIILLLILANIHLALFKLECNDVEKHNKWLSDNDHPMDMLPPLPLLSFMLFFLAAVVYVTVK